MQNYMTGILEDIVSHDAIYLRQYHLKIDKTVKLTLQHLKKFHQNDNNIKDLVSYRILAENDEQKELSRPFGGRGELAC